MRISRIKNKDDLEFVERVIEEMSSNVWKDKEICVLELIYELGVKEGRNQVVKNSIEFISKGR